MSNNNKRNILYNNPLLASTLSVDDLIRDAILLQPVTSQGNERDEPKTDASAGNVGNIRGTNVYHDNNRATTTVAPNVRLPTDKNEHVANLRPPNDDDFDFASYYARLHSIPDVPATITSVQTDSLLKKNDPDAFAEIDLTSPSTEEDNFVTGAAETQSYAADLASNLSQLPNVLPHVANTVFSSFSHIWGKSKPKNEEVAHNLNDDNFNSVALESTKTSYETEDFQKTNEDCMMGPVVPIPLLDANTFSVSTVEYGAKENNEQLLNFPPMENKQGTSNAFRLSSTKSKKVYAKVPGLTLGDTDNTEYSDWKPANPLRGVHLPPLPAQNTQHMDSIHMANNSFNIRGNTADENKINISNSPQNDLVTDEPTESNTFSLLETALNFSSTNISPPNVDNARYAEIPVPPSLPLPPKNSYSMDESPKEMLSYNPQSFFAMLKKNSGFKGPEENTPQTMPSSFTSLPEISTPLIFNPLESRASNETTGNITELTDNKSSLIHSESSSGTQLLNISTNQMVIESHEAPYIQKPESPSCILGKEFPSNFGVTQLPPSLPPKNSYPTRDGVEKKSYNPRSFFGMLKKNSPFQTPQQNIHSSPISQNLSTVQPTMATPQIFNPTDFSKSHSSTSVESCQTFDNSNLSSNSIPFYATTAIRPLIPDATLNDNVETTSVLPRDVDKNVDIQLESLNKTTVSITEGLANPYEHTMKMRSSTPPITDSNISNNPSEKIESIPMIPPQTIVTNILPPSIPVVEIGAPNKFRLTSKKRLQYYAGPISNQSTADNISSDLFAQNHGTDSIPKIYQNMDNNLQSNSESNVPSKLTSNTPEIFTPNTQRPVPEDKPEIYSPQKFPYLPPNPLKTYYIFDSPTDDLKTRSTSNTQQPHETNESGKKIANYGLTLALGKIQEKVNLNKIQNAVASFFDPNFYDGQKEVETFQPASNNREPFSIQTNYNIPEVLQVGSYCPQQQGQVSSQYGSYSNIVPMVLVGSDELNSYNIQSQSNFNQYYETDVPIEKQEIIKTKNEELTEVSSVPDFVNQYDKVLINNESINNNISVDNTVGLIPFNNDVDTAYLNSNVDVPNDSINHGLDSSNENVSGNVADLYVSTSTAQDTSNSSELSMDPFTPSNRRPSYTSDVLPKDFTISENMQKTHVFGDINNAGVLSKIDTNVLNLCHEFETTDIDEVKDNKQIGSHLLQQDAAEFFDNSDLFLNNNKGAEPQDGPNDGPVLFKFDLFGNNTIDPIGRTRSLKEDVSDNKTSDQKNSNIGNDQETLTKNVQADENKYFFDHSSANPNSKENMGESPNTKDSVNSEHNLLNNKYFDDNFNFENHSEHRFDSSETTDAKTMKYCMEVQDSLPLVQHDADCIGEYYEDQHKIWGFRNVQVKDVEKSYFAADQNSSEEEDDEIEIDSGHENNSSFCFKPIEKDDILSCSVDSIPSVIEESQSEEDCDDIEYEALSNSFNNLSLESGEISLLDDDTSNDKATNAERSEEPDVIDLTDSNQDVCTLTVATSKHMRIDDRDFEFHDSIGDVDGETIMKIMQNMDLTAKLNIHKRRRTNLGKENKLGDNSPALVQEESNILPLSHGSSFSAFVPVTTFLPSFENAFGHPKPLTPDNTITNHTPTDQKCGTTYSLHSNDNKKEGQNISNFDNPVIEFSDSLLKYRVDSLETQSETSDEEIQNLVKQQDSICDIDLSEENDLEFLNELDSINFDDNVDIQQLDNLLEDSKSPCMSEKEQSLQIDNTSISLDDNSSEHHTSVADNNNQTYDIRHYINFVENSESCEKKNIEQMNTCEGVSNAQNVLTIHNKECEPVDKYKLVETEENKDSIPLFSAFKFTSNLDDSSFISACNVAPQESVSKTTYSKPVCVAQPYSVNISQKKTVTTGPNIISGENMANKLFDSGSNFPQPSPNYNSPQVVSNVDSHHGFPHQYVSTNIFQSTPQPYANQENFQNTFAMPLNAFNPLERQAQPIQNNPIPYAYQPPQNVVRHQFQTPRALGNVPSYHGGNASENDPFQPHYQFN